MQTQAVTSTTTTSAAAKSNIGSKDTFLKLLTAQMKYQNPLKPKDGAQMSSQLAQFNAVEQQLKSNSLLQKLVDGQQQKQSMQNQFSAYLGRNIQADMSQLQYTGTSLDAAISLPTAAQQSLVQISDQTGKIVRQLNLGALSAGIQAYTWDGRNQTGAIMPKGSYRVNVIASDAQGQPIQASSQISGILSGIHITATGETSLMLGNIKIPSHSIRNISL